MPLRVAEDQWDAGLAFWGKGVVSFGFSVTFSTCSLQFSFCLCLNFPLSLNDQFADRDQLTVVLVIHEALIGDTLSVMLLSPRPSLAAGTAGSRSLSAFRSADGGSCWLL